ncbi:MAG: STAS domain-containing protein [Acidimicrobiia bacterium]
MVPVFAPTSRIDETNVAAFAKAVDQLVAQRRGVVVDCSEVVWIAAAGMRVLAAASHSVPVTLTNPNPAVHLVAVVFGGDVRCHFDRVTRRAVDHVVHRPRLAAVPTAKISASSW